MADYGTLNGQPVGPELPDPVPCERCGHPIWLGENVVAFVPDPLFPLSAGRDRDRRVEMRSSVWELSLQPPPWNRPAGWDGWALEPHRCRPPHRSTSG